MAAICLFYQRERNAHLATAGGEFHLMPASDQRKRQRTRKSV
ncbi:hypothetical protein L584_18705 [Pantoea agglomerans Tx10]|nr:hypothetical protein L584_18705 [Pantoea agglomerans Tx10]